MSVIEIARVRLKEGASHEEFVAQNVVVEADYITAQPGCLSRRLTRGEDGEYVVVVEWRSVEDADASMDKFAGDPSTAGFMALIDPDSMSMERFEVIPVE